MNFDTLSFLQTAFRDPDGVVGLVGKRFDPPQREAVRKWFSRQAIPADWWPVLIVTLEDERGGPISLKQHFGGGDHDVFG